MYRIHTLCFNTYNIKNNVIMVSYNQHIKLDDTDQIHCMDNTNGINKRIALYNSIISCTLVALLRYVKINDIGYIFTNDIIVPNENGTIIVTNGIESIRFVDKIYSNIPKFDWYSSILN